MVKSGASLRGVSLFDLTVSLPMKLIGTQPLDSPHGTLTVRTETEYRRFRRPCWKRHGSNGQQFTTQRKELSAPAIGKQTEVPDAREPARQDVLEKASQELLMCQRHDTGLAVVGVVFPAERHVRIGDIDQAMVRDRNAVCVAGPVMKYMFRSAEGLLGVHNPVLAECRSQESRESLRLSN